MEESGNLATYYFHQGTNFKSYEYLGCNLSVEKGKYVYSFRTWAPNAEKVSLVSDFCGWDTPISMKKITDKGVWECFYTSEEVLDGASYKFKIENKGQAVCKGDPYAAYSKGGADGASMIYRSRYKWHDKNWLKYRRKTFSFGKREYLETPINVYEVHAGSFIRHDDNSYYTYRELTEVLIPYVKYMGFTHVEFLPLSEYPYDGSWGYQVCGFFAPTSRFGTPDDFRYLVDSFHKNGIGVILDWVPAHFPKDEWGLYEFDGEALYEYQGDDRRESETWGTRLFDLGREEVQSFLISSAMYFLKEFHIDGLRVDAVASMLYLDYDKTPGKWIPNIYGERENLESVAFLKKLNTAILGEFPDVLMIAEESGSYGGITNPVSDGGLGFSLKWNMGWANDFYDYLMTDPYFRKYKQKALTFPIMYAFSERYIMPISHDEVVHGKKSFINKMHGKYEDKFRQMRTALLLMMTYPGKKMMFMGTEFAQFREWDFENSLEWFMLDYPTHEAMREYVAALNRFYLGAKELWEMDFSIEGFEWIFADEADKNTIAYKRFAKNGEYIVAVINFSGAAQNLTFENSVELISVFDTGEKSSVSSHDTKITISTPAYSGAIFKPHKKYFLGGANVL